MVKTLFRRFMDQPGRRVQAPLYCSEFHNLVSSSATVQVQHVTTSCSGLFFHVPVEVRKKVYQFSCRFDAITTNPTSCLTYGHMVLTSARNGLECSRARVQYRPHRRGRRLLGQSLSVTSYEYLHSSKYSICKTDS